MNIDFREAVYNQAKTWILEAGAMIRKNINKPVKVDTKSNANDLVTSTDKDIELFFVNHIKNKYPNHFLLSEEGYGDNLTSLDGTVWIIDPIDGTMNFVHQKRNFAISIGIYHNGIGEIGFIYDVMADNLYHAKRGCGAYKNEAKLQPLEENVPLKKSILGFNHRWLCENTFIDGNVMQKLVKTIRGSRTIGSAALEFAFVTEGILDGYIAMRLSPWDFAAGIILVNEVGGTTTNYEKNPVNMVENSSIITCNSSIYKEIMNDFISEGVK